MEPDDFVNYLEAKYLLDYRSLSAAVQRRFQAAAGMLERPIKVCDLGTGSGAMVRRVLQGVCGPLEMTAVDLETDGLAQAAALTRRALLAAGFTPIEAPGQLVLADYAGRRAGIRFRALDLASRSGRKVLAAQQFDIVTGHAIMDLLPLRPVLEAIRAGLRRRGLFYATLTYNGRTTLLPGYPDRRFENTLFELYDASMDARGARFGGRCAGARLYDAACAAGLAIESYGASDWQIVPNSGRYSTGEADVARALIETVFSELSRSAQLERRKLGRWRERRLEQIEAGELVLVVHHTDLLARKPPSP